MQFPSLAGIRCVSSNYIRGKDLINWSGFPRLQGLRNTDSRVCGGQLIILSFDYKCEYFDAESA